MVGFDARCTSGGGRSLTRFVKQWPWNVEHRVFAMEHFFTNKCLFITVQRLFRQHFNMARHGLIPDRQTIHRWVIAFQTTGSVMKNKLFRCPCTAYDE